MPLGLGSKLGPYAILSPLGAGGMGEVYRARDPRLGREVAIKVLPADRMADEDRRRRFVQEARAASALNHPNIVTIHEIGSVDGIDFIVVEYVAGKTPDLLIPAHGMRLDQVVRRSPRDLARGGRRLEPGPAHSRAGAQPRAPRWSPDGRRIAFDSQDEDGGFDIWTIDAEGGPSGRVADPRGGRHGGAHDPLWRLCLLRVGGR